MSRCLAHVTIDGHLGTYSRLMLLVGTVGLAACEGTGTLAISVNGLAAGTWGGTNAGVIVDDAIAHVHVGCTNGNFAMPVSVDAEGRFSVAGDYMLRAFPVPIGPTVPAQFTGKVDGRRLTLTVAVNDTVEKKLVTLGPVQVTLGVEPRMGPCPICRKPLRSTIASRRNEASIADQRHHLLSESLHFLELRTALQQQQVDTDGLELANAMRHLRWGADQTRPKSAIRD